MSPNKGHQTGKENVFWDDLDPLACDCKKKYFTVRLGQQSQSQSVSQSLCLPVSLSLSSLSLSVEFYVCTYMYVCLPSH